MEGHDKKKSPGTGLLVCSTAAAAGQALHGSKYAIVGGAACALLGAQRATLDVDVVVPCGRTKAARTALKASESRFHVDPRTQHVYLNDVSIEILAPPVLFRSEFKEDTPTLEVNGASVLKPTFLLNCKCASVCERRDFMGKHKDAHDIQFLLQWCIGHGHLMSAGTKERDEVPNATKEFVEWFVDEVGVYTRSLWEEAGFRFDW